MNKREIIEEIKAKLKENDEKLNKQEILPVEWGKRIRDTYYTMKQKSGYAVGVFDQLWMAASRERAIESGVYITTQYMMP